VSGVLRMKTRDETAEVVNALTCALLRKVEMMHGGAE
jgi:hypothetical protein